MHCWSLRTPHARGLRARVGSQAAASAKGSGRRRACRCGKREVVAAAVMAGSLLFSVSSAGSQNKTPRQQGNLPNLPVVGVSGAWLDSYQDELAAGVSFSQLVQDAVARCAARPGRSFRALWTNVRCAESGAKDGLQAPHMSWLRRLSSTRL